MCVFMGQRRSFHSLLTFYPCYLLRYMSQRREQPPPPQAPAQVHSEYVPPLPLPRQSDSSPMRRSMSELPTGKPALTLSDDEALFSKLLQLSNDKLLADLKESVESKVRHSRIAERSDESETSELEHFDEVPLTCRFAPHVCRSWKAWSRSRRTYSSPRTTP